VTTYTSVDDCDRSTPPPDSDSDRSKGSDTDRTASCDSAHGDFQLLKDLQRAAKEQEEHISLLQAQCNQAVIGAHQQEQQYHELEEKYARQIAQRRSDKNKVDEAWEYCQEAKEQINDLKAQIETLENLRDIANAQHKAEMQTKNREMAQLRDNQQCAISALEYIYKTELEAKQVEIEQVKALLSKKDVELDAATRKALDDLHKVTATSESNRQAWMAEKKQLELKIMLIGVDARDTMQKNEDEIERITKVKQLLIQQVDLLVRSMKGRQTNDNQIEDVVNGIKHMQEELYKVRRKNTILEEKIENTLESMQQDQDHWAVQYKKEKQAQTLVESLRQEVDELEEKLARRDELLRDLDMDIDTETSRSRNALGRQHENHAGTLGQLVSENGELHDKTKEVLEEKAEVQTKFNKLDDVNLDLTMRIGDLEKLRREEGVEMGFLRKYRTASETELEFLTNAYQNSDHFSTEHAVQLREHLRKTTIQIQTVTEQASFM
jgi:hypothetical protein